jgi:hypothetical protein
MSTLRNGLIVLSICALILGLGCAPKRIPMPEGEKIPLSQVLSVIAMKYQGVRSLRAQVTVKLEVQDESYLLQGFFLYENPASLRLQLATSLGPTIGEMIYTDGLLTILVPSEEKLFQGRLEETWLNDENLFLTMSFQDYLDTEHGPLPTCVYGEVEDAGFRFELRLKEPTIDVPLPAGAFIPRNLGWEEHPLADLKGLLQARSKEGRP